MSVELVALVLLELDAEFVEASIKSAANPEDRALCALVGLLGDQRETARRMLGDAIIKSRPDLRSRVREVVKFSADGAEL